MKTKLYVLKAASDFDGKSCQISAYLDEVEALEALDVCQTWQKTGDDLFRSLGRIFECRKLLDETETYELSDLLFTCPVGAHAAIHGMETASIIELEFEFEFDAISEMAVINAEAGIRNVKAMDELK